MALLAEQIVEEWITRKGYFTIRGLKVGNDELDLLAIKNLGNDKWDTIHIEVQVSIRPVSYISGLSPARQKEFNISGARNATTRNETQLKAAVDDWVNKKFKDNRKHQLRKELSNSDNWKFMLVHGNIKIEKELEFIGEHGIELKHIRHVIKSLREDKCPYKIGSATDIIDLMQFI